MVRRAFGLLVATLALAACVQSPEPSRFAGQPYAGNGYAGGGYGTYPRGALPLGVPQAPVPVARGVSLLAPLTGPNAELGAALVNAARLALDAPGSPPLDVRDTGGTAAGAASAATAAIAGGAGLIIGPLTAAETGGAAGVARNAGVPILAFTNDSAQAQPGVWTLGITPGQQVRRMVGTMALQGKSRFSAILPQTAFGTAMGSALTQATAASGLPAPDIHTYQSGTSMDSAVRAVASYDTRLGPMMARLRAVRQQNSAAQAGPASAGAGPAAAAGPDPNAGMGNDAAAALARQDLPPLNVDAVLIAETGTALATLTGLLQSYEITAPGVRTLGPALWALPQARGGASMNGAWYAAPDPNMRSGFDAAYSAKYGRPAPGISDFAFDAGSVARVLGASDGYSSASLCRPDGYAGVDGVFALEPDGRVRRGMALFEMQGGQPQMIEPAPSSLRAPGI